MVVRVRFMLLSIEDANKLPSRITSPFTRLAHAFSFLPQSLSYARLDVEPENYLAACTLSALGYGLVFGAFFSGLGFLSAGTLAVEAIKLGVVGGFLAFLSAFGLHLIYPRLVAQQVSSGVDQGLLFALRSLQIQVSSGVSLYDAMTNVAKSDYGFISREFEVVVQEINAGVSESTALERLALRTQSPFLRKTIWQLITNIRAGSPLSTALTAIMASLTEYQSRAIKSYAAELNMWILLYLLIAAALPTIGITFMVILSSIGGSDISEGTIFSTVAMAFVIQVVLIGLIGTRAPKGYR